MSIRKSLLNNILIRCKKELKNHEQAYKHWTFLVRENKIFSFGVNKSAEPKKTLGYHSKYLDKHFVPKWHSEWDAIFNCKRKIKDCIVVNVRLIKNGETRMSMPCAICRNILKVVGVKKIFFTTENGWGTI